MGKFPDVENRLRQGLESAIQLDDACGHMGHPHQREVIADLFKAEEGKGEISLDFIQGFYSGLFQAMYLVFRIEGGDSAVTRCMQGYLLEAAKQYVEASEKELKKS